ncbi:MAG TPA: oxidoreductase [Bacilli bacterium]
MQGKSALIIGASGFIGGELLKQVLNQTHYTKVTILTRKHLEVKHPKLKQYVVNFDVLPQYKDHFKVDHVFCCLGTTMKTAKSRAAFKKVDLEYPLQSAKLAKEGQAGTFLMVSAMGADVSSKIFYNQVKGAAERAINELRLPSLHIFRPSLLLGDRQEFRVAERIAAMATKVLFFIWKGPLEKYKPIEAAAVARAMMLVARHPSPGTHIHESSKIAALAAGK